MFHLASRRLGVVLAFTGLMVLQCWAQPARSASQTTNTNAAGQQTRSTSWSLGNIFKQDTADLREFGPGDFDAVAKLAADQTDKLRQSSDLQNVAELFQQHRFEEVEAVAKAGKINAANSEQLALARRQMINQAMSETLSKLDIGKEIKIGMLDSGNKGSGIASDVDQTIFVIPPEKGIAKGITEKVVIEQFNKEFKRLFNCEPKQLGIASMNGADFHPDWRGEQTLAEFSTEADRVVNEKRKDSEAYRTEGQLKSQAEGRGYLALQEHGMKVEALDDFKSELAEIDSSTASEADKAKMKSDAHAEFSTLYPEFNGKTIPQIEEHLAKNSPWTEVDWSAGADGKVRVSQVEDPRGKVLKMEPEMVKRFAFDGAWDNWIMFETHAHNRRKYLLRSMSEGISLLRPGLDAKRVSPLEYEKLFQEGDQNKIDTFLAEVYPDMKGDQLLKRKKALAVASMERLKHKGASYTEAEIWKDYLKPLSEGEKKMYAGMPEATIQQMQMERAHGAWDVDAREIMFENMIKTVTEPHQFLNNGFTPQEFAAIQKKFPGATPEKLEEAVRKQLFQSAYDLLSIDHVKALVASPEEQAKLKGRNKDLVDRFLEQIEAKGPANLKEDIDSILRDAARQRFVDEPGLQPLRIADVYEKIKSGIKSKWDTATGKYEEAKKNWESGKYTKEYVSDRLFSAACEHIATASGEYLHSLGFNVASMQVAYQEGNKFGEFPIKIEFEAQKFDAKRAMQNLCSVGNLDSALRVMLAYQSGSAKDAAWALGGEIVMNLPGVAHVNAAYEAIFKGEPRGAIMLGATMLIPGVGEAYLLVSLAQSSVTFVGHMVLDPLSNDDSDKAYQGFLGKENSYKQDERSQRASILDKVPIHVVSVPFKDKDGKDQTTYLIGPYSVQDAVKIGLAKDEAEAQWMQQEGLLGGGEQWDENFKLANDWLNNPRRNFDAKRASIFYHYENRVQTYFKSIDADLDSREAGENLTKLFLMTVNQWVQGEGEFAGLDENTLIARRFPDAVKLKLASRMAGDFLWSYQLLRHDTNSLEKNVARNIERARNDKLKAEVNGQVLATTDTYKISPDTELGRAVRYAIQLRREKAIAEASRIHLRPTIVMATNEVTKKITEQFKSQISIVANTNLHPGPYSYKADWLTKTTNNSDYLSLKVAVFDCNKKPVGLPEEKTIGKLENLEGDLPFTMDGTFSQTRFIVKTKAMSAADETYKKTGSAKELEFVIWRAESEDGPFQELSTADYFFANQQRPFISETNQARGRLDAERMAIFDTVYPANPKAIESPFFYRVSLRQRDWVSSPKGMTNIILNEITSNVKGSTKGALHLYDLVDSRYHELEDGAALNYYTWVTGLTVSFSADNQAFDFPGAHIILKWGDWTGHFWSASTNAGWESQAAEYNWTCRNNKIRVFLPGRMSGTLQMQGSAGDFKAQKTITLNFKDDNGNLKMREDTIAAANEKEKQALADYQKSLADKQRYIERYQQSLAKARQEGGKTTDEEFYLESANLDAAAYQKAVFPKNLAEIREARATSQGDMRAALENKLIQLQADADIRDTELQRVAMDERLYHKDASEYARRRSDLENNFKSGRPYRLNELIDIAYRAGDSSAMMKAFNEWVAMETASTNKNEHIYIGPKYMSIAGSYATLTGDQSGAVALYKRGEESILKEGNDDSKKDLERQRQQKVFPTWWPRTGADKVTSANLPKNNDNTTPASSAANKTASSPTQATTQQNSPQPASASSQYALAPTTPTSAPTSVNTPSPATTPAAPTPVTRPTPPPASVSQRPTAPSTPTADTARLVTDAVAAFGKGDFPAAVKLYDQVLAADPKNSQARSSRGAARIWTTDVAGALDDYRELAKSEPDNLEARRMRALLELAAGDRAVAATEANYLVQKNPSALTWLLAGEASYYNGRADEAKNFYQKAAAADPQLSASLYAQGNSLQAARVYSVAYLNFSSALWLKPEGYGAYYAMGTCAMQMGWKDQAIEAYSNYLKYDSTSTFAQTARQQIQTLRQQK